MWDKERIKNLRKSLGLSQAEFAHRLGCRQQTVSEWELGIYAPANAYTRLLNSFVVAPSSSAWLSQPKGEETRIAALKKAFEPFVDEVPFAKEFDPAID